MIEIDVLPASEKQSADAILLRIGSFSYDNPENNDQKVILIDSGWQSTAEKIENHLNDYYYTDTIDYVFITHPDRDHISGLLELLENKNIKISRTFIHDPWNYKNKLLKRSKDGRRTINSIDSRLDENLDILSRILDLLDERKIMKYLVFQTAINLDYPNLGYMYLVQVKMIMYNYSQNFRELMKNEILPIRVYIPIKSLIITHHLDIFCLIQ